MPEIIMRLITNYSNIFDIRMLDQSLLISEINNLTQKNINLMQQMQNVMNKFEDEKKKTKELNEEINLYKSIKPLKEKSVNNIKRLNESEDERINSNQNELMLHNIGDIGHHLSVEINIYQYNSFSLKFQQIIASKISNLPSCYAKNFFSQINILSKYLLRIKDNDLPGIFIQLNNDENLLSIIREPQLKLRFNIVNDLFENNELDSLEFINILEYFSDFQIEIIFPHQYFQKIYDKVVLIKKYLQNRIKIGVYISGISEIGPVFRNNSNISYIEFDSKIMSIGNDAFSFCSSLTSILLPSSITSLGKSSFNNCSMLKQISIPTSLTCLQDSVFCGCSLIEHIIIPSSVTKIEQYAFNGCVSLKRISIPSSVISIGDCAFNGCSSLKYISIPSSVTSIGDCAFNGCSSLKQISLYFSIWLIRYPFPPNIKINWQYSQKQFICYIVVFFICALFLYILLPFT